MESPSPPGLTFIFGYFVFSVHMHISCTSYTPGHPLLAKTVLGISGQGID